MTRDMSKHYEAVKRYKDKQSPEWRAEYNRRNEFSRTKSFIRNKARMDELIEIKKVLDEKILEMME